MGGLSEYSYLPSVILRSPKGVACHARCTLFASSLATSIRPTDDFNDVLKSSDARPIVLFCQLGGALVWSRRIQSTDWRNVAKCSVTSILDGGVVDNDGETAVPVFLHDFKFLSRFHLPILLLRCTFSVFLFPDTGPQQRSDFKRADAYPAG